MAVKRDPIFFVHSIETLKAISDPLRLSLLDEIGLANDREELRTVRQLADSLQTTPHKLYYHMHMLETHGLIRVADTQIISGIIEKHYALSARRIQVAEELFNSGGPSAAKSASAVALFDAAARSVRTDFITLMESTKADRAHLAVFDGRGAHFTRERVRMSAAKARAFQRRLLALTEEFSNTTDDAPEAQAVYTLLTVFIPSLPNSSLPATPSEDERETA